jgi:hypothetical protein
MLTIINCNFGIVFVPTFFGTKASFLGSLEIPAEDSEDGVFCSIMGCVAFETFQWDEVSASFGVQFGL